MTNDELLTELIDALRKVNVAATDAAKNHYTARAAELETALRAQLAQAQRLLDAAVAYGGNAQRPWREEEHVLEDLRVCAEQFAAARAASAAKVDGSGVIVRDRWCSRCQRTTSHSGTPPTKCLACDGLLNEAASAAKG